MQGFSLLVLLLFLFLLLIHSLLVTGLCGFSVHDSVLICLVFLGIHPFNLHFPICLCTVVHTPFYFCKIDNVPSFLILVILISFSFIRLAEGLSIFFILSKNQLWFPLFSLLVFFPLYFIYLCSKLLPVFSFLLLALGLV